MKLLKNNGFSMIQVMMAAGMMGVLSLGMMKMMETQRKSAKSIKTGVEVQFFYNELRGYMGKSAYCLANFEGQVLNEGDQFELEEIVKPNGKVLFKVGELYGERTFRISKIEVLEFESDSDTSGIMKLQFVLDKIGKSYGAKSYKKILKIDVVLDVDGKVTSCATMGSLLSGLSGTGGIEGTTRLDDVEETVQEISEGKKSEESVQIQKTIDNNPKLKELQNSIDSMQQTNNKIEEMMNQN